MAVSDAPLVKVRTAKAAEICAHFNLPKEARGLLKDPMNPGEFIGALLAHKQYVAGIDFMAHALPPREAIWWGCLCLQQALGDTLDIPGRAAASAAVRWVLQPADENREAAKAPAEAIGQGTPAGALAAAVAQTGGSVAPPKAPPAPPAPFAPAKSVAVAVKLATIKGDPARILERQRLFVELAIGVARGRFCSVLESPVVETRRS